MAGAVAEKLLDTTGVKILAHTVEIGGVRADSYDVISADIVNNNGSDVPTCGTQPKCWRPSKKRAKQATAWGGIIECIAINVPVGLGQPIFDTLEGDLGESLILNSGN